MAKKVRKEAPSGEEFYLDPVNVKKWGRIGGKQRAGVLCDYGGMDYLASSIKYYINSEFDVLFMCTGEERGGKSTAMIRLAKKLADMLDTEFPLENICFRIKNFNEKIDECDDKSIIMMDEAGHQMFAQEWWNRFQRTLIKKLQVIGMKNLVLILNLPSKGLLNKRIRERRAKFWGYVETKETTQGIKRGFLEVRKANWNRWKEETFWEPDIAFKFKQLHGEFWDRYEDKKREFIEEVTSGSAEEELGKREAKWKRRFLKMLYLLREEEKDFDTLDDIAENYENMNNTRISQLVTEYKEEMEEDEDETPKRLA